MNDSSLLSFTKRIGKVAKLYKNLLFVAIIGVITAKAAEGVIYKFLIPDVINKGLNARESNFLSHMPLFIFTVFFVRSIGEFLSKYFMSKVARSVVRDQRVMMLEHLLSLPTEFFKQHTSGELISKINYDAEQVSWALSDAVLEFLNGFIATIFCIAILFSFSWQLTLVVVSLMPFFAIYLKVIGKIMRRYSSRVQDSMASLTQTSHEVIDGFAVIKAFNGQDTTKNKIHLSANSNLYHEMKAAFIAALSAPLLQMLFAAFVAGFVFLVTRDSISLSAGEIFGFIGALFAAVQPLKRVTQFNNILQRGIAASISINKLLEEDSEPNCGKANIAKAIGKVSFKQINFGYSSDKLILDNLSFEAMPGETIALVGKSGGGKTTLMSLLMRFYDITQGSICIDDINIQDLELANLRSQISIVSQNVVLFNDTIANNIAFGCNSNASREDIIHALKAAHAFEFVEKLEKGLDSIIGEDGTLLSGGQRQRLAIARAILKNTPILILDEATSALDNESEQHIKIALQNLMKDRTTFIIAHRLSTIVHADKILVIEHGKIVEVGRHSQLIAKGGRYAKLHNIPTLLGNQ